MAGSVSAVVRAPERRAGLHRPRAGSRSHAARGTGYWRWASAENQWAIAVGLKAGLVLTGCGPLFVGGELGTLASFLPNGAYV